MTSQTTIYPARAVHTMDPSRPHADAVAVRDGLIRAVGSVKELSVYPGTRIDDRYADKVLVPGFVEAHSHVMSGGIWDGQVYVGYFDRTDPDGEVWPGCADTGAVLERLRAHEKTLEAGEPLCAWGLDPIYFPGDRLAAKDLDTVTRARPVKVQHANGHVCVVNSAGLEQAGITSATHVEGVEKDDGGEPTGELREFAAMMLINELFGGLAIKPTARTLGRFAQEAVNQGVTTVTDLGSTELLTSEGLQTYRTTVTGDFPVRLSVFHMGLGHGTGDGPVEAAQRVRALVDQGNDKLRMGHVKLLLDGSIQGFTARLMSPGYLGDQPNGIWNMSPEEFEAAFTAFHKAGLLIHVHCNGDQASQLFLDTLERVLIRYPRPDHRHTITHSQLTTQAQYRRAAALHACANIFSNHIWTWGDQHVDTILGADRASRMNAARSALDAGVPISLHCDTPITPLSPLKTMKHAITRLTPSGRVLGEFEKISVYEALRAVTIGSAFMLKMDDEVGSIEAGKRADLAILDEDPFDVAAEAIGEIRVAGTMTGGVHHGAGHRVPETAAA